MPMDIHRLQARLRAFSEARGWEPYQTPKNLAMAMVVEAAVDRKIGLNARKYPAPASPQPAPPDPGGRDEPDPR